jgi:phosphatidylserine/phosphatidylglycerophosphate/cardiolipin synthase-like enzyme
VEVYDPRVASELNRLFDADWDDISFTPYPDSPLMISPFNSREKMSAFIASASKSIHITDAKVEDPAIVELLAEKARQGVEVRILGKEKSAAKRSSAIEIRESPRFKLHAKCIIVDGSRAVIGSMNLRSESFDRRREVSIIVDDADVLRRLNAVFASDWEPKAPASASAETIINRKLPPAIVEMANNIEAGLVLISRTDALVRYSLRQGPTSIGRSDENDIVIADPLVSRRHARITLDDAGCTLTDLGGGNGTFLNGERVNGTAPLKPGDVIEIGRAEEFRLVEL